MVLNLSMVIGQTLFVSLLNKFTYMVKFLTALIPLIILMIVFPVITEFPSDQVAWILSITGCALIGNDYYIISLRYMHGIAKFIYNRDSWNVGSKIHRSIDARILFELCGCASREATLTSDIPKRTRLSRDNPLFQYQYCYPYYDGRFIAGNYLIL